MRQDHAARAGEQREVQIGVEATRDSIPFDLFQVITAVRVMLGSDPYQQVEDRKALLIQRRFARGERALPELGFIHQIQPVRDGQRRIEEELLQGSSSRGKSRLGVG